MSIPPLVCSTPPPPDQCEEDNDNEEFDIPYNLSQEDEDDGYDYGNFSFNHCSVNTDVKKDNGLCNIETLTISDCKETTRPEEIEHSIQHDLDLKGNNIINNDITKCEEDPNIEDLDLKINEPEIFIHKEEQISDHNSDSSDNIVNTLSEVDASPDRAPSPCDDEGGNITSDNTKDLYNSEERIKFQTDSLNEIPSIEEFTQASVSEMVDDNKMDNNDFQAKTNVIDDEFGDFEDFQCVSSVSKSANNIIETCDNPWVNQNDLEDNDFGEFTANFEPDLQKPSMSVDTMDNCSQNADLSKVNDDDDDFGDFDDFKSSAVEDQSKEHDGDYISKTVPVLNFQVSDNEMHVMESISKVLSSIFEEEISQPEREFEGSLESVLGVSWGHLRETDIRQPYILNWNNSLGQKTLLKALCIDSRNILFGPKWGYTPPKFAANLSVAPLQPQKPLTSSNAGHNEASTEKTASKPGNWIDSFTSDGQEFTYAEALLLDLEHLMATLDQMAHNHSSLKISELLSHACNAETEVPIEVKPSDLDMFEAAVSSKPDKIYSSTLSVQPLRQISLPDTHIFTPTDSETPRSKTIHYDSGPPILLPQPVLDNVKKPENPVTQTDHIQHNKDDEDYWEFRDYRSNTETPANKSSSLQPAVERLEQKSESKVLNSNITYQTQVLQPVKMEPIMPTLNWPDPGEVKETFDDFSDFISSSSWAKEKNNSQPSSPPMEKKIVLETEIAGTSKDNFKIDMKKEPSTNVAPDIDDEFDTFQSALPPPKNQIEFNFNKLGTNKFNNIPNQTDSSNQTISQIADFDFAFSNNIRTDAIQQPNTISNEMQSLSNISSTADLPAKPINSLPNHIHSSILQPVPANTGQQPAAAPFSTQQNTVQILQPLSLESYSQINWPSPGIDLQDLSKFNPVETLQSLKTDLSVGGPSKTASPIHNQKPVVNNQVADDDIWGEFVSSKPKQQPLPKKPPAFADDDEWTDFVSSPTVKPINGLNTISLNVHTNSSIQKSATNKFVAKGNQLPLDIPTLNYITPKTSGHNTYNNRHFENL